MKFDVQKKELHLVAPLSTKKRLTSFYQRLIELFLQTFSEDQKVILYGTSKSLLSFKRFETNVRFLPQTIESTAIDIWIRDYAPIRSQSLECKFRYSPVYYDKSENEWVRPMDQFGRNLSSNGCRYSDLILDGGNLIENGEVGILTEQVLLDNKEWERIEIEQELKSKLGLNEILIIPCEPGDETGHIDGVVRFLSPSQLVVADYPDYDTHCSKRSISKKEYDEDKCYLDQVARQLSSSFEVIRLKNGIPTNQTRERMPSAVGNYMNFFRYGGFVFLPQYDDSELDLMAVDVLRKQLPDEQIILVECTDLAVYGGVLNCITWEK